MPKRAEYKADRDSKIIPRNQVLQRAEHGIDQATEIIYKKQNNKVGNRKVLKQSADNRVPTTESVHNRVPDTFGGPK